MKNVSVKWSRVKKCNTVYSVQAFKFYTYIFFQIQIVQFKLYLYSLLNPCPAELGCALTMQTV